MASSKEALKSHQLSTSHHAKLCKNGLVPIAWLPPSLDPRENELLPHKSQCEVKLSWHDRYRQWLYLYPPQPNWQRLEVKRHCHRAQTNSNRLQPVGASLSELLLLLSSVKDCSSGISSDSALLCVVVELVSESQSESVLESMLDSSLELSESALES